MAKSVDAARVARTCWLTCYESGRALQAAFVADDVSNIIKESIDAVLQNQQYSEAKVRVQRARPSRERSHLHKDNF